MSNNKIFSLSQSALNPFLFAEVGIEASGQPLSVMSLLARGGKDPWSEAAALAAMSAPDAIANLARSIATMPAAIWALPDATRIAGRLVACLPRRSVAAPVPDGVATLWATHWRWVLAATVLLAGFAVLILQSLATG